MQAYGMSLRGSVVQTDNGTEFTSPWNSPKVTVFTKVVERCLGAVHHLIPPGAKTFQSDVESSHRFSGRGTVRGRDLCLGGGVPEEGCV